MVMQVNLRAAVGKTSVAKRDEITTVSLEDEGQGGGLLGPVRRVCLVCKSKASAYTCPRCGMPYCSSACYKNHGTRCTESFYRSHIERELRVEGKKASGNDQGTPTAHYGHHPPPPADGGGGEEEEAEEIDEEEYRRLEALSLSENLDVGELTEGEHLAFRRAMLSGELGKMVEVWEPWWSSLSLNAKGEPLITEAEEEGQAPLPPPPLPLPGRRQEMVEERPINVSHLLRQSRAITPLSAFPGAPSPSPSLPIHLIDLLYAYTYICRVYNGCWSSDIMQACSDLLSCSTVLKQTLSPPPPGSTSASTGLKTARGALAECCQAVRGGGYSMMDAKTALGFAQDVASILKGKVLVLAALCDMVNLLVATMVEVVMGPTGEEGEEEGMVREEAGPAGVGLEDMVAWLGGLRPAKDKGVRRRVRELERCVRKLLYFMGWASGVEGGQVAGWRAEVLEAQEDLLRALSSST